MVKCPVAKGETGAGHPKDEETDSDSESKSLHSEPQLMEQIAQDQRHHIRQRGYWRASTWKSILRLTMQAKIVSGVS